LVRAGRIHDVLDVSNGACCLKIIAEKTIEFAFGVEEIILWWPVSLE
jgi:hypothetical protein